MWWVPVSVRVVSGRAVARAVAGAAAGAAADTAACWHGAHAWAGWGSCITRHGAAQAVGCQGRLGGVQGGPRGRQGARGKADATLPHWGRQVFIVFRLT